MRPSRTGGPFIKSPCGKKTTFGISSRFQLLSQSPGQVSHVLRTRSPLNLPEQAPWTSFDLHVLSTPPAFILSQDQTLQQKRGQKRQRKSDEHPTQQTLNEASSCMWPSAIKAEQTRPITRTTDIHVATGKKPTAKLTDNLNQHPKRDTDRTARTGVLSSLPFSRSRSPEHAQPRNKTPNQR